MTSTSWFDSFKSMSHWNKVTSLLFLLYQYLGTSTSFMTSAFHHFAQHSGSINLDRFEQNNSQINSYIGLWAKNLKM